MTPADFAAEVRELATVRTTTELEQRVGRLAVRMETCKQEPCTPSPEQLNLEAEITKRILELQGDAIDVAPFRRCAAFVCGLVREIRDAERMLWGDTTKQALEERVEELELRIGDMRRGAEPREARIAELEGDLAAAKLARDVDHSQIAKMLGLPVEPLPPDLMLFALLKARLDT